MNVTKTLEHLADLNTTSKSNITMTTLFGHALAHGLHKMRRDVGRLNWSFFKGNGGRIGLTIMM